MDINLESFIFYLLLIDAIGANLLAWSSGERWWHQHLRLISRYFPMVRGWTTYYLALVLLLGIMLYRLEALVLPW